MNSAEVDRKLIQEAISKKYGLIQRFLDLSGMTRYKYKYLLNGSSFDRALLWDTIAVTHNAAIPDKELTDTDKYNIRKKIEQKYVTISNFCKQADIKNSYMSRVLNKRLIRKDSARVQYILNKLDL